MPQPSRPTEIDPDGRRIVSALAAFTADLPSDEIPAHGMEAEAAYLAISYEMELDGDPRHNLATFVTTFMDDHAARLIAENLHRNFIDHAEYPQTAEIEQRCIRMLSKLYNAPDGAEPMGARCQGSSEAIMLGLLAHKWSWRARREAAGQDTAKPNVVSAPTCTSCGTSSPATSTSSCARSRCARPLHVGSRRRGEPIRREHDRRRRRGRHHVHSARTTRSAGSTTCS